MLRDIPDAVMAWLEANATEEGDFRRGTASPDGVRKAETTV
jgi:hypothetical protein